MRILIATDNYYPNVNGAAYFTQRLAYYLKKRGHQVRVVASSRNFRQETFEHNGVEIYGIPSMPLERIRIPVPFIVASSVSRAVELFRPDVIHIQSHFAVGRGAAEAGKRLGIPVVGTNHFMPENLIHYLHLPSRAEEIIKNMGWNYCLTTFNHLDAITSPTKTAADLLRNVGLNKPVIAISNGIDLQLFNPSNDGVSLKAQYKIPCDKPVLLFVGRLDKEKYLDLVIHALAQVVNRIPVTLVIAGIGAERNNLEKLADKLGLRAHVIFAGFVPDADLPQLYALADCFIMAGTAELQSIVTMEAMATGLPMLAVRAMALPELVVHGENGFLFEHGDVAAMAQAILQVFTDNNLRETLGRNSLKAIQKHDINLTIDRFEDLYRQVQQKSKMTHSMK